MQIYKALKKQTVTIAAVFSRTGAPSVTGRTAGKYVQSRSHWKYVTVNM